MRGCPGEDGFACDFKNGYLFFRADSDGDHWQELRPSADVTGIVNAGGCGMENRECVAGDCAQPRLSTNDDCKTHRDVDFEFHLTPLGHHLLAEANLWGDRDHGPGDLAVEWEWMYFSPRERSADRLAGKLSPQPAAVPWRGDQAAVRGALVLDCGEVDRRGARAELHPPVAMIWMHADEQLSRSATVYLRASSRFTDPHGGTPFGPAFEATFAIPGAYREGPVHVGPIETDWLLSGYRVALDNGCHLFDLNRPRAHVEGGDRFLPATARFAIKAVPHDESGTVTVSVEPLTSGGAEPELVGAHFRVCVPDCDACGANLNACPGACPRTASCAAAR